MKRIEDIIKKNEEAFHDSEPKAGHFERFREKLEHSQAGIEESWFERNNLFLKIAAAIILFAAISTLIYTDRFSFVRNALTDQIVAAELPDEIVEVMQYYNVITDKKVSQIDDLAISDVEADRVKQMAYAELKILEDAKIDLEQEYTQNPNNERIMGALLLNQKKREEILDRIIKSLNQVN